MMMHTWKDGLAVLLGGILVAVVAFLGLQQLQQWRQDAANLQAIVRLLNYNIAQGHLVLEPVVPAAPPVARALPDPPKPPDKP